MKLNKKQKRTATIASMAALLAVVLGMGGQTFAKYVTTNRAEAEQATVAKWGVVIRNSTEKNGNVEGVPTFNDNYNNNGVKASTTGRYIVAPNTSGAYSLLITGTPEVATKVTIELNIQDIYVEVEGKTYYPIVWTLNDTEYSGADAVTKMKEAVNKTTEYAANKDMSEIKLTVEWKWAFDNSETPVSKAYNEYANGYDTILGDLAAAGVKSGNTFDDPSTTNVVETNAEATAETTLILGATATVEQIKELTRV